MRSPVLCFPSRVTLLLQMTTGCRANHGSAGLRYEVIEFCQKVHGAVRGKRAGGAGLGFWP